MYNKNNILAKLVVIKPEYHIVHFIKGNSFFSKIIGYNQDIKIYRSNKQ